MRNTKKIMLSKNVIQDTIIIVVEGNEKIQKLRADMFFFFFTSTCLITFEKVIFSISF